MRSLAGWKMSRKAPCLGLSAPKFRIADQTTQGEQRDVVAGAAFEGQIGENFPDYAGELEAVARAGRGHHDLRIAGEQVEDEVLVRRIGEQAGVERECWPGALGEVALGETAQNALVFGFEPAVILIGIHLLPAVMIAPELEARDTEDRESVVAAFLDQQVEDGEGAVPEPFGAAGRQPGEYLPLGDGPAAESWNEAGDPRARRNDETIGFVLPAFRGDRDAARTPAPCSWASMTWAEMQASGSRNPPSGWKSTCVSAGRR